MRVWEALHGQADDAEAHRLSCMPISSPLIAEPRSVPIQVRRRLARDGLLSFGMVHAYLHDQLTPQARIRTVRDLVRITADTHSIRFTPAALALLDRAPVIRSPGYLQPRLQLADVPLARYTPKIGRGMLSDPSPTAANYQRWRADWVADAESTRWTAIHHMPLEAKHISLVYQEVCLAVGRNMHMEGRRLLKAKQSVIDSGVTRRAQAKVLCEALRVT
ncbi:hypothetical protein IWQ56_001228, partial [Coemansia nantahalensis]